MKTHYSCAELAQLKLPGFPINRQTWHELVKREGWEFTEVKGLGGPGGVKREYLPPVKIARLIELSPILEAKGVGASVTLTVTVSLAEATHITRWLERQARK